MDYQTFLATKAMIAPSIGVEVEPSELHPSLFGFQRQLVVWSVRKGRAALFTTTGSGKTRMQGEWARIMHERTGRDVLILAPLAVAQQTVTELAAIGITVTLCRDQSDVRPGLNITNYDRLHLFTSEHFGAVVLDESGILKNFSGTMKKRLIEMFRQTPYRLCCTATPAPNDTVELANHADFLGVMKPNEIISTFFTPRGLNGKTTGEYRLKRHAHAAFFQWLASWSMSLTKPSDLGYPDDGFILPPLSIRSIEVKADWVPADQLLFTGLQGVGHRTAARRATTGQRVDEVAALIAAEPDEQWLIWRRFVDEGRNLAALIPGAVTVEGSETPEAKAEKLTAFARGDIRVLATDPAIAGFGMNFQSCARMAFLGIGDSFEQYFQALRRCWRFGQTRPVHAYVVTSDIEGPVYDNVLRKEAEHEATMRELLAAVAGYERTELQGQHHEDDRPQRALTVPAWLTSKQPECVA